MDDLQYSPPDIDKASSPASNKLLTLAELKKSMAAQAYRKESSRVSSRHDIHETQILRTLNRWLASGDIRIEFYLSKDSENMRVKIVPDTPSKTAMDLSITTFMGLSKLTM